MKRKAEGDRRPSVQVHASLGIDQVARSVQNVSFGGVSFFSSERALIGSQFTVPRSTSSKNCILFFPPCSSPPVLARSSNWS